MGQHKYNPNCQLAREGKLPPKPKKIGKRERERLLYAECQRILLQPLVKAYVKMHKTEKGERESMAIPDSSRLPNKIRDPNPCTGCTRPWKNPGCHDHCTDREVWLEELRRVDAARKAYKARKGL